MADPKRDTPMTDWNTPETAPKDGTMLILLIDYSAGHNPLEDAILATTIGFNNLKNTGIDVWQIAGWNWCHDCFCEGEGEIKGWLTFKQAGDTQ